MNLSDFGPVENNYDYDYFNTDEYERNDRKKFRWVSNRVASFSNEINPAFNREDEQQTPFDSRKILAHKIMNSDGDLNVITDVCFRFRIFNEYAIFEFTLNILSRISECRDAKNCSIYALL